MTTEGLPETRVVLTVTVTVAVAASQVGSELGSSSQGPPVTKNLGVWA